MHDKNQSLSTLAENMGSCGQRVLEGFRVLNQLIELHVSSWQKVGTMYMYVCMYVSVYKCMYVGSSNWQKSRHYVNVWACMHACVRVCMHEPAHQSACVE